MGERRFTAALCHFKTKRWNGRRRRPLSSSRGGRGLHSIAEPNESRTQRMRGGAPRLRNERRYTRAFHRHCSLQALYKVSGCGLSEGIQPEE